MAAGKSESQELGPPAPAPLPVRARLSITEQLARVDQVTTWIASGLTPRQCSTKCKEAYGLRRYQADRYVAVALKRLQADNAAEPIESTRARLLAMHYDTIRQADEMERIVTVGKNADGSPQTELVPQPDLRARTAALEAIAKLTKGLG